MRVYNFDQKHGVLVNRAQCSKQYPELPHRHEFVELVYTYAGHGTHLINGQAYPVRRGDLLFINYKEVHAIESDEKMLFYNLLVKPQFLCDNLIDEGSVDDVFSLFFSEGGRPTGEVPRCAHFSGMERAEIEQLIERMWGEASGDRTGRRFVLNGYMRLLFGKLLRALQEEKAPPRKPLSQKAMQAYLEAHFTAPITIATMAATLQYHPAYLGRAFRNLYGMGMKTYLRQRRMDYAAALLAEGEMTVSEVIPTAGYTNRTQFYRDFAAAYGCTPAAYREGKQKEKA